MGLLDGIFGGGRGGDDDPYADILTPAQRNQQLTQGLLAMAGAFAQAGMPSRIGPVPIGSAIGSAAAALGAGQESGMTAALANAYKAQQVRDLRSKAALQAKLNPLFQSILDQARNPASAASGAGAGTGGVSPEVRDYEHGWGRTGSGGAGDAPLETDLPYPNAPGAAGLLGAGAAPEDADLVGTGLLGAAPPPRNASLTGAAWELANNNLGGMRRPGVVATPSQGGFQTFDTPEAGLAAISRQLDRYASGATTGTPLTTIRQVVSTWAPPNENPTEALIKRAAQVVGVNPDQPLDFNNPTVKAKLIEATIRNEQGGKLPVDPALITKVAGSSGGGLLAGDQWVNQNAPFPTRANPHGQPIQYAAAAPAIDPNDPASLGPGSPYGRFPGDPAATGLAPDTVIPSARSEMGGARMMQAQYSPITSDQGWGPNWSQAAPAAPSGGPGGAAPGGAPRPAGGPLASPGSLPALPAPGAAPLGAGGKIPGMNVTPQELAVIDAMAESAGLGNPFKGLLDTYYKSPGYLGDVKRQEKQIELETAGPLAEATARGREKIEFPLRQQLQNEKALADLRQKIVGEGLTVDDKGNVVEIPGMRGMLGKTAEEIEAAKERAKAQFQPVEATVIGPDGKPTTEKMTAYEFSYRRQQAASRTAMGAKPQPGDIVGAPLRSPGETKSEEAGATAGWKALEDTHAAERAAIRSDQQLGQMGEAMRGFTPGATAELRTRGQAILRDFGLIKGDEVPSAETFQRMARQIQLNAQAGKGQGAISNYERDLVAEGAIQMGNTPEGIAKAIGIMQRLNEYDKTVARIHRDVASEGRGMPNLVEAQRRIAALGPPLSSGEIGALEQIRAGKVPGPGQTTAPPAGVIDKATYDRLPSGATFTAPDGSQRVKP